MTSDNDGDSVVVSSGLPSGLPSPVPGAKTGHVPATAAKGILVHNNKKSANTNRVSFVTNSSSSPSAEQSKKKHNQPRRSDDDDRLPYHARTGRRLTGFGVKSYLHEFYDDPDGSELFQVRIKLYTK
ncbi:unnamed protein product [Macrosiphum euphorbiae]|uniref:Uncharacterized protein n=1 Tax=Macrosiphum euphorbiae TaxID=13131 RepID=A0AAV0W742_9HEMI|nr:unnamed protein product [Macrosiphum euphorbiae]